jgi:hypothetical protein
MNTFCSECNVPCPEIQAMIAGALISRTHYKFRIQGRRGASVAIA